MDIRSAPVQVHSHSEYCPRPGCACSCKAFKINSSVQKKKNPTPTSTAPPLVTDAQWNHDTTENLASSSEGRGPGCYHGCHYHGNDHNTFPHLRRATHAHTRVRARVRIVQPACTRAQFRPRHPHVRAIVKSSHHGGPSAGSNLGVMWPMTQ